MHLKIALLYIPKAFLGEQGIAHLQLTTLPTPYEL